MPDYSEFYQRIADRIAPMTPDLVATRRALHQYPEVGWLEFQTAAYICETLAALGYTVRAGRAVMDETRRIGVPNAEQLEDAWMRALEAGASLEWLEVMRGGFTGVIADLDTGKPGPRIAFRFDLDALPISEARAETHRPSAEGWASTLPQSMHACGHDGHIAIGIGVARLLLDLAPTLTGRIRLIFQPAEEGVRGAASMMGACEGIDYFIALHLGLGVPSGEVIGGAVDFLASRELRAHFIGKAAHAGRSPEEGRSALLAAAQAVLALHTLAQHGNHATRVNAGVLHGGVTTSIVPADAELFYRIRADDNGALDELDARARTAVTNSALTYGCRVELELTGQASSENSHPALAALVAEVAQTMPNVKAVKHRQQFGASEDATLLMREVHRQGGMATYIMLGADVKAGHHNDEFDFDESALPLGVELLVRLVVRLLAPESSRESA